MQKHVKRALSLLLVFVLTSVNCMVGSTTAEAASKVQKITLSSKNEQTFVGGGYNLKDQICQAI